MSAPAKSIVVVGVPPAGLPALAPADAEAVARADVVAAGRRHLEALTALGGEPRDVIEIAADVPVALDAIEVAIERGRGVVVLASGDPGYFGIGRALAERFGEGALDIRPAVSSIATAFARAGLTWDDAVVVSAHGRPLREALAVARTHAKVAVLASPDNPPERIGLCLVELGTVFDRVMVVSDLGMKSESVSRGGDVEWLAKGRFSPLSIVLLVRDRPSRAVLQSPPAPPPARFGLLEEAFEHRNGMITKAEVRAIVLARLELPSTGLFWDVGAGSGSVAIEAAKLSPALAVIAIERATGAVEAIKRNAERHHVCVEVVHGEAPAALFGLGMPDRAFVGGGGLDALDAVLDLLAPGGRVVATYASLDRAVGGAARLGNLVQVSVSRSVRLPDDSLRLRALDPVFVCWGPS
jgi:precorrin-6Y C5,15-methyltransferase (decarboxylating)